MNGYFEGNNGNKYLTIVSTNENKEKIKRYEELCSIIWYLVRIITKIWDDNDKKYMKIKFSSDDKLPLNKKIETPRMKIVLRAVLHEKTNIVHKFS